MTIFQQASQVFPGSPDPESGLAVLRLDPLSVIAEQDGHKGKPWHTIYHQTPCFLDCGKKVCLRRAARGGNTYVLDLATGVARPLLPSGYQALEVCDQRQTVLAVRRENERSIMLLWDLASTSELGSFELPDLTLWSGKIMAGGDRVVLSVYEGAYYDEHCRSELHMFDRAGRHEFLFEADGFFCNHIMPCPTDPDVFAYNRWPCPRKPTDVVIHIRNLMDSFEIPLPQRPETVRPGSIWGGQRDHYLWTPDGTRILSYFSPRTTQPPDHFDFDWWISCMDWKTGIDFAAEYPPERWGCNFAVSTDSRHIISAGGREFQKLYRVNLSDLARGWNEETLCSYAHSEEDGCNNGPFHMPFCLPDQSGVIFTAGWPGPDYGIYMVEWPSRH